MKANQMRFAFLSAVLMAVAFAVTSCCRNSCGPTGPSVDTTPPQSVTALQAIASDPNSVTIRWVAPGDDGASGTAASYDARFSSLPIDASNFASATMVADEPIPVAAGILQSMTITGLSAGTTYYIAIKSRDESQNVSGLSNVLTASTPALGAGFVRARIGGVPWSAAEYPGRPLLSGVLEVFQGSNVTFCQLVGVRELNANGTEVSGIACMMPDAPQVATFTFVAQPATVLGPGQAYGALIVATPSRNGVWGTDAGHTGTITITSLDAAANIAEGTFSFTALNAFDRTTESVANGVFKVPIVVIPVGAPALSALRSAPCWSKR